MSAQNNGGPAFPQNLETAMMANLNPSNGALGMTLRDYFAAKALDRMFSRFTSYRDASEAAYKVADEMLKARG